MDDSQRNSQEINPPSNITVTSADTIDSILVGDGVDGPRVRNLMQSVEFSPTLQKASFRSKSGPDSVANFVMQGQSEGQIRNLSQQMMVLYLQHLGNAIYFMVLMTLGFVYPLVNALSYSTPRHKKSTEEFEIFMIIIHGFSVLLLTVLVVRLTLHKSDEDRVHGEGLNFFLRIGAIVFCIGAIILGILRALEPLELLLMHGCAVSIRPTHTTFHCISVFFYAMQTYFLFKYHKTSFLSGPNKQEKHYVVQFFIIRLALMHLIAINLIQWLNSIMWEAVELFKEANHLFSNTSVFSKDPSNGTCSSGAYNTVSSKKAQGYLFPCVIEYSLIAASALLAMYVRVGIVEKGRIIGKFTRSTRPFAYSVTTAAAADEIESESRDEGMPDQENITIQSRNLNDVFSGVTTFSNRGTSLRISNGLRPPNVDSDAISTITTTTAAINRAMGCAQPSCKHPRVCEKSHVGFFFGLMFLAGSIVYIACEFIFDEKIRTVDALHVTFSIIWSSHYLLGIVLTLYLTVRLTTRFRFEFRLSIVMEKLLLYVTYFGNLIFVVFCIMADIDNIITNTHYTPTIRGLYIFSNCMQIVQESFQAAFIFYGLNLRANSRSQRRAKPGRTALTIAIFLNMIIWLRESLLLKTFIISKQYVHFFGLLPWCMISSACFPLIIFFRFHCASLLAEIWSRAYD